MPSPSSIQPRPACGAAVAHYSARRSNGRPFVTPPDEGKPQADILPVHTPPERSAMLLTDPITLLCIIIPFGLMTMMLLCLSYVGMEKGHSSLHWWIAGDLLLAAYRSIWLLQPEVLPVLPPWLGLFTPDAAFLGTTGLLLFAIGGHTLALSHLTDGARGRARHLQLFLLLPASYLLGAWLLLDNAYLVPWFLLFALMAIAMQFSVTLSLAPSYRGAWGLLAGQAVLLVFHGGSLIELLGEPMPPLAFDGPDLPDLAAMLMDVMVSFLFTLSYALMLQERLRLHVQRLSITDTLTGALNRRGALPILTRSWAEATTQQSSMAVAMIDLDNFKRINDEHGHAVGDAALQCFANSVGVLKRRSDVLVRWGGEEFLLLMPETDVQQAASFLARLRESLKLQPLTPALPLHIEFSAGLADAAMLSTDTPFDSLLRGIDKALYRAKRLRDRVEVMEPADL